MLYVPFFFAVLPFFFNFETNFLVGRCAVQHFMVVNKIFNELMHSSTF